MPINATDTPLVRRWKSVPTALLLAAIAALAVLAAISVTSVYLTNEAREDAASVTHTIEVQDQISNTLLFLRRAESAERGFLITSDNEYSAEFEEAIGAIKPALDSLRSLVSDNPEQIARLDTLTPLTQQRIDQLREVMTTARSGQAEQAMTIVRGRNSREISARIRDIADGMRRTEDRLFEQRRISADSSQFLAAAVTITGSGLVIALALTAIMLLRRSANLRDEAEQKIREANANLEYTVQERTSDLREANEEIQRFAYIVSHDLRSPLVNIMGFTSELEELRNDIFDRIAKLSRPSDAPPAVEGEARALGPDDQRLSTEFDESLGFIKSSIGKMDRLISAILNLTREGRREFKPIRLDMREMLDGVVSSLAHQTAEANAEITIGDLPEIVSDRLAVEQIFSNLIDNALKYLNSGVPGKITVNGRRKLGFAVFDVADNGRGIDPQDHQRIFDLFRRAGTQDKPGQGIGLAHVRAFVRRLGGTLSVNSELGKGSTFTVTLPINWTMSTRGYEA